MSAIAGDLRRPTRWPRWWTSGVRSRLWWAAAIAFVVTFPINQNALRNYLDPGHLLVLSVGQVAEVMVGLLFWMWRPGNIVGPLIVAYIFLETVGGDAAAWGNLEDSQLLVTINHLLTWTFWPLYIHMLLVFPNGELWGGRWARRLLVCWYVWALLGGLSEMLFVAPWPGGYEVPSYLYVGPWSGELVLDQGWWIGGLVLVLCVDALLIARLRRSSPGARRRLLPLFAIALIIKPFEFVYVVIHAFQGTPWGMWFMYLWVGFFLLSAAATAFGLGRVRHARSGVSDLVVELGKVEPGHVRDALARTLGDPSLVLGLWLPDRGGWADEQGREIDVPRDGSRGVTYVGERLAVLIHDRDLLDQPRLLESVGSAARLALENERLQAELRAQLAELRESRARIVAAGDEERRRLERDLHDGAQQRLLELGMALELLRPHLVDGEELLDETEVELQSALAELRELARGIHPAVLTEHGLDAALRTLAERAPLPVTVDGTVDRLPPHVETAAYFVAAEALVNVTKHAHAHSAVIRVGRAGESLTLEIADDGIGGAYAENGSGLRGLADRVGALDGHLVVESAPGAGTLVRVDIPLRERAPTVLIGAP